MEIPHSESEESTDPEEITCDQLYLCTQCHETEDLQQKYDELRQDFDEVCRKYNIRRCSSCGRHRTGVKTCICGLSYCGKCNPLINRGPAVMIRCDKCGILTCTNCSIDTCTICNLQVCRRAKCIAYVCDGSRYGVCDNIICSDEYCSAAAECIACSQLFCSKCKPNHLPCKPIPCSCGELVYRECANPTPLIAYQLAQIPQLHPPPLTYPLVQCPICPRTSCAGCHREGARHRAGHYIVPFIIANNRGDLPCELSLDVIYLIWGHLLRD